MTIVMESCFKVTSFFKTALNSALQLQLYFDELEICNPLGVMQGKKT